MKTLITFVYVERAGKVIQDNLRFFLRHGVLDNEDYHYNFVINGHECSIEIPKLKNVSIIRRDNVGYDFGAYTESIESVDINEYDYFIFMNDTVRGPFLPTYIPSKITWVEMFLDKLDDKIKLVGPTINWSRKPHIQSMCFGTDLFGLKLLIGADTFDGGLSVNCGEPGKNWWRKCYVGRYEKHMSLVILGNGLKIKPFQLSQHIKCRNAFWEGKYFGDTFNPLELMFIKTNRINNQTVKNYTAWTGLE